MKPKPKTHRDLLGFSEDIDALVKYIAQNWTGLKGIKPKGYEEFIKDYIDFKGMKELDHKQLETDFEGCNNATATSFPFPIAMSLPHISYDDICQGREPFRMLVSHCVAYGMMRGEALATKKIESLSHTLGFLKDSAANAKKEIDEIVNGE